MAQGAHFDGQRALDIEGACGDRIAGLARLRQVFTGQQGLIDARLPVEDHAIRRQHGARVDQYAVAQCQFRKQDAFTLAIGFKAQAGGGQQIDQLRRGGRRAFAGAALKVATGQQE